MDTAAHRLVLERISQCAQHFMAASHPCGLFQSLPRQAKPAAGRRGGWGCRRHGVGGKITLAQRLRFVQEPGGGALTEGLVQDRPPWPALLPARRQAGLSPRGPAAGAEVSPTRLLGNGGEGQVHVQPTLGAGLHEGHTVFLRKRGGSQEPLWAQGVSPLPTPSARPDCRHCAESRSAAPMAKGPAGTTPAGQGRVTLGRKAPQEEAGWSLAGGPALPPFPGPPTTEDVGEDVGHRPSNANPPPHALGWAALETLSGKQ